MKSRFSFFLLWIFIIVPTGLYGFQKPGDESDPFSLEYDEGPFTVKPGEETEFTVLITIPEEHYIYKEALQIEVKEGHGFTSGELSLPEAEEKEDPFFKKVLPIYHNMVALTLKLKAPAETWAGERKISGLIRYQGCSAALCYKLESRPFVLRFVSEEALPAVTPVSKTSVEKEETGFFASLFYAIKNGGDFEVILSQNKGYAYLLAFLGGVATDLTPCVWPLIPITLALIGVRRGRSFFSNLLASVLMVCGMAVTYAILGTSAALLGKSLGFIFQSLFFLVFLAITLLLMAAVLLGLIPFPAPLALQNKIAKIGIKGYPGVFFVGMTLGIMAAPCVGPIIGPLLVYVAKSRDVTQGIILLVCYALGMGVIFIVLGGLLSFIQVRLKGGRWTLILERFFGVLMLLVALYYAWIIFGQFRSSAIKSEIWINNVTEGIRKAKEEGKPLVVDFYAQWCGPCIELEHKVWSKPAVQALLKEEVVGVKIDCTQETPVCKEAIDRYKVIGWPTIVFVKESGEEDKDKRLVGKVVTEKEMLQLMEGLD